MNIFFIGSAGALSLVPFERLLNSSHEVVAVGVYRPITIDQKVIALENGSLALVASQQGIPVIDLSKPVDDILTDIEPLSIDLLLMSCYPKRLPARLIEVASRGSYNLHPSLLPRYRGPEPLFWQMRDAADVGISWHRVSTRLDEGNIIGQQAVSLDDGMDYHEINHRLAICGAELLESLLPLIEAEALVETRQDSSRASYLPYPQAVDFTVDLTSSARQVFNFMKATEVFNQPYRLQSGRYVFLLDRALDYDNNLHYDDVMAQGNRLFIPFSEGVLISEFTDKIAL